MTRRPWMFWKREEHFSSSHSRADIEGCREWTPFLTALFDGEANEEEALQARRHMIVCERCAGAWLDWNQTRHLLLNHSAPPPPPNLLWRVRMACRLGQSAEVAAPELSAQILARTSRQNAKPAFWSSLAPRVRLNSPVFGALALGAFAVFMARGALVAPPIRPNAASFSVRAARSENSVRANFARRVAQIRPPILAAHAQTASFKLAVVVAAPLQSSFAERSLVSLARARRERESLQAAPVQLTSVELSAPLPMLAPPRRHLVPVRKAPRHRIAPVSPDALSSPVDAPSVVLASAPATESAPTRAGRTPRVLLASARLRISAPRALPITMQRASAPDDSGLDDLDSTVQEYRATLVADSDSSSDAG